MKSQRIVKEIVKTEKLPLGGQTTVLTSRKNRNSNTSNVYTVKETTLEKKVKRSYNTGKASYKSEQIVSSNLKQGTNSGYISQNKIPVSNKEDSKFSIIKTTRTTKNNISEGYRTRRYTKREIEKIIKIQRWWRRILAILDGYKIRESLFTQNKQNYVVKSQKIYTEKYVSSQSSNRPSTQNFKNSNSKYTSNNINLSSKSYTNINNITSNMKQNLNPNANINTSSSQNYIQTIDKRVIRQSSPKAVSGSTSPSVKSKYIIETKKVEVFRKPKNTSENKFVKETKVNTSSSISNYEVKQLMRGIWSNEIYCSPVESLCCLGDDGRSNTSQNTLIYEDYEEEIRKLKTIINQKDDELNNLMMNLKEVKNQLNVNISKNIKIKKGYNLKNLDEDAHELQIISTKLGWNDVNIPSPVNEMFIESIENRIPQRMQYIEGMQIMGKKQEESVQESISDPEAVLEIQEMNALSIISNKRKYKNICQHLQSLMILSTRKEESEEYTIKEKEEKNNTNIEIIPVEKEPLVFQKIEQINYKSIVKPKPRKPINQIQELDGIEIINYKRPKIDLKRKTKTKLTPQNIDKIALKYSIKKVEVKNSIQELDGLEILKAGKKPNLPQCVDELEIEREYDMLLVKPTWNSLQIQGSGLNLLAMPRDMGLENQEVDEFEILGMEKPALYIESLEKISYEKPKSLQKIQVLIPLPENSIVKKDNFRIFGTRKAPKVIEKEVIKKVAPNRISKSDRFRINGIKKEQEVKIVEKIVKVERKIAPNKIVNSDKLLIKGKTKVVKNKLLKLETFLIKGREKVDNKKIVNLGSFKIKGKEKVDNKKVVNLGSFKIKGKEKVDNKKIVKSNFKIRGIGKVDNNKIIYAEDLQINGIRINNNKIINSEKVQVKGKQKKIVKNRISKIDKFIIEGEEKMFGMNKIIKNEKITYKGKQKKIVKNRIMKIDKFLIEGEEKKFGINKIIKNEKIAYKGKEKKIVKNKIIRKDKIQIKGFEKEEEPEKVQEENIEENVIELSIIKKQKKIIPNKIKKLERFRIRGIEIPKQKEIETAENLRISKAYSTKQESHEFGDLYISKRLVISLYGKKKVEKKQEIKPKTKIIEKDWNKMIRPSTASKLIIKNAYKKVKIPEQQIIEKEEIETVEKIYKNWNDEIRPIKSTKLNVKGERKLWDNLEMEENDQFKLIYASKPKIKIVEKQVIKEVEKVKEKEEFDIESFSLNISESGKKFRESLHIENGGFDLEGNKGMILKEGPAQTIKITKEQILVPSRVSQFNLLSKIKKIEKVEKVEKIAKVEKKPKIVLKLVKENKLFIKGIKAKQVKQDIKEKIKTVEKIVEVEKKIDWNKTNKIENKGRFNLLKKKKSIVSAKQRTNCISLIGSGVNNAQIVQRQEQTVVRDWTNSLHAQRNAKFALLGKQKIKKFNLIVANGDKFFIQKESEDEIIYNDDYNTRKDRQKLKDENEKKKQIIKEREIIKEKEIVPRLQREIRAQISKLKESESSETSSSISEIDVLAAIKSKKMIGYAAATEGNIESSLIGYKKTGDFNGYQTKVISGEVVFTAKNGLGVNLGGASYQRQIKNVGYSKKISNITNSKISGIEIINPNEKNEIFYQKMAGVSGAIADGNYRIIDSSQIINDKGLAGSISCKQMKITNKSFNSPEYDFGNNGQSQSYKRQVIITSKTENISQNELNGSPSSNIILKSKTKERKISGNSSNNNILKRDSHNSGNNSRIKGSPSGANIIMNDSPNSLNNMNQQIKKKTLLNSRFKTDSQNSQNSSGAMQGKNKTITTTKQYQMRINTNGDKNERIITETKKTTEVKIKKK